MTQVSSLFTELSTDEAQTVQGGRCHRRRSFYRPDNSYYSRPQTQSFAPAFNYGYGYGGWGNTGGSSSGSVTQTVNVNVVYED